MPSKYLFSLLFAFVLAGCSGGGGSASGPGGGTAVDEESMLVVDGAANSSVSLVARLAVIALERADGTMTGNLLAEESEITLADAGGEVSGLPLRDVPPGDYAALILWISPDSVVAVSGTQRTNVTPASLQQRVDFGGLMTAVQRTSLMLAHDGDLEIVDGEWRPRWIARFGPEQLLRLPVVIESLDRAALTGVGRALPLGGRLFRLDFSFTRELETASGWKKLKVGAATPLVALVSDARSLQVLALHPGRGKGGIRGVLGGEIRTLDPAANGFVLVDDLGATQRIAVDASTLYVREANGVRERIGYADLQERDRVRVVVGKPVKQGVPGSQGGPANRTPIAEFVFVADRDPETGGEIAPVPTGTAAGQ